MIIKKQCKACGHEMPTGGICPLCGYTDIIFPKSVPDSIIAFEKQRVEQHRSIAARLTGAAQSSQTPRTMLIVRNLNTGEFASYPIEEGLNTYGSRPERGIPHIISLAGVRLAPMQFAVKLSADEVKIQPAPNTEMYLHGRRLEKAYDARCRTFAIEGAEITVIKL